MRGFANMTGSQHAPRVLPEEELQLIKDALVYKTAERVCISCNLHHHFFFNQCTLPLFHLFTYTTFLVSPCFFFYRKMSELLNAQA